MQRPSRVPWIDYLRGFITVLVVAHHSSLAYTTFASFNSQAYILSTHPVVDSVRSRGLDIFEDFNDVFFMSLMFLISGIFVLPGLARKGRQVFIRDRFYRLFIPFMIGVTILMPIAYFPAWYLAHHNLDLRAFIIDFFTVEGWPVGPPWFIWVLFLFNLIIALTAPFTKALLTRWSNKLAGLARSPVKILLCWFIITWCLYMPLVLMAGPDSWTGIGPFDFQISRVLLYFGYFILGILIGATGTESGLFAIGSAPEKASSPKNTSSLAEASSPAESSFPTKAPSQSEATSPAEPSSPAIKSPLGGKWLFWTTLCLSAYTLLKISEQPLTTLFSRHQLTGFQGTLIYQSIWVLSCTVSSIAFLALFQRLFTRSGWFTRPGLLPPPEWSTQSGLLIQRGDRPTEIKSEKLWNSLSANAYGIYLVHYIFVVWSQFLLLNLSLPAAAKFIITFSISLFASWRLTSRIRKIKWIGKYL